MREIKKRDFPTRLWLILFFGVIALTRLVKSSGHGHSFVKTVVLPIISSGEIVGIA